MQSNKRPTQCDRVLSCIREHGSITSLEAADHLRIVGLAQRIFELKQRGYPIRCRVEKAKHTDGQTETYNRYFLLAGVDTERQTDGKAKDR